MNERLASPLDAAVTRLRLEEITSQLIRRVVRQVEGLQEILGYLASAARQEFEDKVECSTKVDLLAQLLESVRQMSQLIDGQLRKAVAQRWLEGGGMALF